MSQPIRVLIDVDDVIADYKQLFVSAVIATGVRQIDHRWQRKSWDLSKDLGLSEEEDNTVYSLINMPGMADKMNPLPGAVEAVKRIAEIAEVYFVTSPLKTSPTWAYDRQQWLIRHFGKPQGRKICSVHDKWIVAGDILVDDKPENCHKWAEAWPASMALYWQHPTMPSESTLTSVSNWEQVELFVQTRRKMRNAPLPERSEEDK